MGYIWDFKYGYSIVEVVNNFQLICYALGLFAKHEWNLGAVIVTIVQPRPYHPDGRVRSWTITKEMAGNFWSHMIRAVTAAHDERSNAVTGDHCKYCKALHGCEAARRAGMNAVDVSLQPMGTNDPTGAELASELVTLRRAADAIKLRLDAIEAHAITEIDANRPIPGFSIDRAYGRRKWTGDLGALEMITGETLMETKPITPAEAERRGISRDVIKQFTTTPETGRKLVQRDASEKAKEVFGT